MNPRDAIRDDLRKLYPGAVLSVRYVNMNRYEATAGTHHHTYLIINGEAVRQN